MKKKFSIEEWHMEKKFSMEWNMEWKIFSVERIWNGKNSAVWNMEKSSSIPFHSMPWWPRCHTFTFPVNK